MGTCLGTTCHGSVRPATGCIQTGVCTLSQPCLLLSVALVVSGITGVVKVCTMGQDRLMDGLDPGRIALEDSPTRVYTAGQPACAHLDVKGVYVCNMLMGTVSGLELLR